jgi:hypothetical protein
MSESVDNKQCKDSLVSISEPSELLLASGIPNVELNGTQVGVKLERVNFNTKRR